MLSTFRSRKMTQATASRITWSDDERAAIVLRAATLIHLGQAPLHGSAISYAALIVEAQNVLPVDRRRSMSSLQTIAKANFSELIRQKLEKIMEEEAAKASRPAAVEEEYIPKAKSFAKEPTSKVEPLVDLGMSLFVETLAEQFKAKLRLALNNATAEVLEEMSGTVGIPSMSTQLHYETHAEVSSVEPPARKIRVGVIGQIEGSDKTFIEKGLTDIFDIRYVESPSRVSALSTCELALIRTKFVSHTLVASCRSNYPNLAIHEVKGSAASVNEWLSEYYLLNVHSLAN